MTKASAIALLVISSVLAGTSAHAETGYDAWLRYAPVPDAATRYQSLPRTVVVLGEGAVIRSAGDELARGLGKMLGAKMTVVSAIGAAPAIVIGTADRLRTSVGGVPIPPLLEADSFWLGSSSAGKSRQLVIAGRDERGALYGAFALLRKVAVGEDLSAVSERQAPAAPIRWVNHWDNLDGSIERGYAGRSIFFEGGRVLDDLSRVSDYGRLLASVGINGAAVNNVNANPEAITDRFIPQLARIADRLRPWGVALAVSIDFSSPMRVGGLDSFDPLDSRVAAFWKDRVDALYRAIPDLAGFVLKADSEGRLGPSAYGRSHADAANVIARALAPHGGVIFYRGFVYDHRMDWRNAKNDRARAAYDNFKPLDGRFDVNVILQIKYGPIDFQVREPPSPLFGTLEKTNQAIELQITQEYLGQQRHVCFMASMWKEILDFDMQVGSRVSPVKRLVSGAIFNRPVGGFVAVSNVGRDTNWLGHDLAMANLYGFGRLAWNPETTSEEIARDWTMLTFGANRQVVDAVTGILLESWPAYERYTGPLGAGTLTDIVGVHYGPGIESSERNGWGQWHRANGSGIGMDRTSKTGTGFVEQYSPRVAARFESVASTPDELLLFFHHVSYTRVLRSGKTLIQHIYDSHYEGASEAAGFVERWRRLANSIDPERYAAVLAKLEYQAAHAIVWRDAINSWFQWISGVPDANAHVRRLPARVEAESMTLDGFSRAEVTPWETASGALAAACRPGGDSCTASYRYTGAADRFDVAIQYFDENDGTAQFRVSSGGRELDSWKADSDFGSGSANGHTSTRRTLRGVELATGTDIRIAVTPHGGEGGVLDYIELVPATR
jgi:alpha-glucuronidase